MCNLRRLRCPKPDSTFAIRAPRVSFAGSAAAITRRARPRAITPSCRRVLCPNSPRRWRMMPGPSRWSRKASPRSTQRSWNSIREAEARKGGQGCVPDPRSPGRDRPLSALEAEGGACVRSLAAPSRRPRSIPTRRMLSYWLKLAGRSRRVSDVPQGTNGLIPSQPNGRFGGGVPADEPILLVRRWCGQ